MEGTSLWNQGVFPWYSVGAWGPSLMHEGGGGHSPVGAQGSIPEINLCPGSILDVWGDLLGISFEPRGPSPEPTCPGGVLPNAWGWVFLFEPMLPESMCARGGVPKYGGVFPLSCRGYFPNPPPPNGYALMPGGRGSPNFWGRGLPPCADEACSQ